jgi:hypothetical protein
MMIDHTLIEKDSARWKLARLQGSLQVVEFVKRQG